MTNPRAPARPRALTVEMLCRVLEAARIITPEQHRDAVVRQDKERARVLRAKTGVTRGRRPGGDEPVHPAEVLVAMGFGVGGDERYALTERVIMQALATEVGLPFVDLDPLKLDAKLAPQYLSRPFARKHGALVIAADPTTVTVAVTDPLDAQLADDIRTYVKREPRMVLSTPSEIYRLITEFYGFRGAVTAAAKEIASPGVDIGNLERYVQLKRVDEIDAADSHVVAAVEYLLNYALDQRASDVHFEPHREQSVVRMRIDGVLHRVHSLPKVVHSAVVSRIKTLARLDIAEKRRAQDGRIKMARGEREVELRVSTVSVAFGEKLVLRVFDPEVMVRDLPDIGLFPEQLAVVERAIARQNGLVLVTGPTGSGKTSTLYATLRAVASPEINVVTLEDPIEIVLEELNQIAVQPKIGLTFPEGLRTVLRQDPDVIMVGEIRDPETATIAAQAALTGHLVVATLHTNDAPTGVTRLLELGVDPFVLASTLVCVAAQRLVRLVCSNCRVETFLLRDQMAMLGVDVDALDAGGEFREVMVPEGEGCVRCRNTGLYGRTGVFEVMEIDDKLRRMIVGRAGAKEMMRQARDDGLMTLREAAIKKLARGVTTFAEVLRVTTEA
ncbi:MAG: type II/IV secretion system protein [Myxococcales bacterium]|nr:type II/IV secretion system protein [Myxococcales bacterium]